MSHHNPQPCTYNSRTLGDVLAAAIDAALEAGQLLRAEFHRPGGPRGSGGHAEVDEQAERVIRENILSAFPAAYRGEETGTASGGDPEHIWLVDPNDGTSAYLKGWRGSAVSIALVRQGTLVLGVVYAPTYPDDNGDLFAWAEGCGPVTRNGKPVTVNLADKDPRGESHCRWCFGGAPAAVEAFCRQDWGSVFSSAAKSASPYALVRPERGASVPDPGQLSRAQGCLLGQLAGDSLGGLVEFSSAAKIKSKYPAGLRELMDGGHWGILAGQPTDDSEMALMLARSIVQNKGYEPTAALDAYSHWYGSPPFDIGGTTSAALSGARRGRTPQERLAGAKQHASTSSQANGSLMRISPLAIFGAGNPAAAAGWARTDSSLTHPHQVCQDSCAVFVAAIATATRAKCRARASQSAWV